MSPTTFTLVSAPSSDCIPNSTNVHSMKIKSKAKSIVALPTSITPSTKLVDSIPADSHIAMQTSKLVVVVKDELNVFSYE